MLNKIEIGGVSNRHQKRTIQSCDNVPNIKLTLLVYAIILDQTTYYGISIYVFFYENNNNS
ncbi:hypothetical protein Hanom_Chr10g00875221 [Helianthus anomalus]